MKANVPSLDWLSAAQDVMLDTDRTSKIQQMKGRLWNASQK